MEARRTWNERERLTRQRVWKTRGGAARSLRDPRALPDSSPRHPPGEVTPTRELTGVMVRARVAKPPQARRSPFEPAAGEEKFLGKKALFIGKSLTKLSGAAEVRQADRHRPSTAQSSSRPSPTGYLVLMLEPQLLVACQQHCCRAVFLHDGPRAARTTMRNALAVSRTLLAVFAPRVLRVSAAARRGAAAYADGDQRMVRARTHQSGLVRPPQSEIRWAFLHNFLRTCR